jgi:3,4-dihydroxy 2-butanone 4-phosphate synthase/GTP cyclohydrolase II
VGLKAYGLEIVDRVPIEIPARPTNQRYLRTKREKLGHILEPARGTARRAKAARTGAQGRRA